MGKQQRKEPQKQTAVKWLDIAAGGAVLALAGTIVYRALPNYDIYWMLAAGRRIVETGAYIYRDPFTFTVAGAPWSPQSYASAIVFFLLHKMGGMTALTVLRMLLVFTMTALTLRTLRRIGVSLAAGAPLVAVMLVCAHSRFTDRGQIFEYVFVAWLVGFLITSHERKGESFYLLPIVVQLLWVQFHSSFLLGPALAALYFAGEWIQGRVNPRSALHRHDHKRAWMLVLFMLLACLVNPNPRAFLLQPLDPAQRELITRFTLEWKSPFDPAIAGGNFHPYYEILLGLAAFAVLVRLGRLPIAPAALMAATAYLSLRSHRFRVEFALVAVPMIALLLKDAPFWKWIRLSRKAWAALGLAAVLAIAGIERERFLESHDIPELYPEAALEFIEREDVAKRPFHPIGFGSYMTWNLYGTRKTFIDGRNFDLQLHRDFILAQINERGFQTIRRKYALDSFILPAPRRSDVGLQNIHRTLMAAPAEWALVFADECAFVYVARESVDAAWLERREIRR